MRRWTIRIFLLLLVILIVVPFVVPLPPTGVDPVAFADADGRFIEVNGLETYVREQGDPEGEPVLLLHGWAGSTFSWRDTITPLAEAGYRVIAFDRPPYGLSQKTGDLPLSMTEQAQFTAAFMDTLGIEQATLIGHSMGGGVVAYFASMYPARVDQLVFVDAAVRMAGAERDQAESPSIIRAVLSFPPARWWVRMGMRALMPSDVMADFQRTAYANQSVVTDDVIAGYRLGLQVENWDSGVIDVLTRNPDDDLPLSAAQVEEIRARSLIIWGAQDTWVEPTIGERLAELLPNDTSITYEQVGHMPMEEVPNQFNEDVIAFLADAESN